MILRKLSIINYKNIRETSIDLSPKMNCFIGHNGAGKTNVLDAVYYLSFCRSLNNPLTRRSSVTTNLFVLLRVRMMMNMKTKNIYTAV